MFIVGLRIFLGSFPLFLIHVFVVGPVFGRIAYPVGIVKVLAGMVGWFVFAAGYVGIMHSLHRPGIAVPSRVRQTYISNAVREALFVKRGNSTTVGPSS
jgi:hypothetical protein